MPSEIVKEGKSIEEIEKILLAQDQVSIPLEHHFSDGLYSRQITVKKGIVLLGHKHKKTCLNILAQGAMLLKVNLEDEGHIITAPHTFHTDPGSQKIAICLEDAVFINVFKTDERDLDKLEEELIDKSEYFLEHEKKNKLIEKGV